MQLIEADALKKAFRTCEGADALGHSVRKLLKTDAIIDAMPTIAAVPVVRCAECKHFRHNLENDTYCGCIGGLSDPEEHDFCSYGERRGDTNG